jgi:predicted ATPase
MSRPRLDRLSISGFRTISDLADFAPADLTVLMGPNGAGKSNLISFFRLLSWTTASPGQLQTHIAQLGGASAVLHQGAVPAVEINARLALTTQKGRNEYGFRVLQAAGDSLVFAEEWFRFRRAGQIALAPGLSSGHRESRLPEMAEKGNTTARVMLGMLRRVVVHQFHNTAANARLRNKCAVEDGRWLKEDAGNLAAFLFRLQQHEPAYYRRIVETIRLVLPFFADFELEPEYDYVLLRWREIGSDHVFNGSWRSWHCCSSRRSICRTC